jgi:hypothetical protein
VYSSLLDLCETGVITPGINHTITAGGDIEGFRFSCSPDESARCLPINRRMFFGTSMVECITHDDRMRKTNNDTVLNLLLNQEEVMSKLTALVQKIHGNSVGNEASFDCIPENLDQVHHSSELSSGRQSEPLLGSFMCNRATDCKVSVF